MPPKGKKNTTVNPSANPFQALGEAFPDPLSVVGGPRPPVVVESRAPSPSLFSAGTAPMTTGAAASSIFSAANPPTAKRQRSDTSYLPGFPAFNFLTNKETITSYLVGDSLRQRLQKKTPLRTHSSQPLLGSSWRSSTITSLGLREQKSTTPGWREFARGHTTASVTLREHSPLTLLPPPHPSLQQHGQLP